MRLNMRFGRFFCIVLSISMLFIFSSCASENSGVLGVYSCARLEMDGEQVDGTVRSRLDTIRSQLAETIL